MKDKPRLRFYNRLRYRLSIQKVAAIFAISLFIYLLSLMGVLNWAEILATNLRYAFKGESLPAKKVVLVLVDKESVRKLGPFGKEWRRYHGELIDKLVGAGVKAIGFDFSFSRPSEFDQQFIDGMTGARDKSVAVVVANHYDDVSRSFSTTIDSISRSAGAIGHAYLKKDRVTNRVRWVPLELEESWSDGSKRFVNSYLSLSAELAAYFGVDPSEVKRDSNLEIKFTGKSDLFQTYSYSYILSSDLQPEAFKGKLVLVGTALPAHRDSYDIPGRSQVQGVEIHAHAVHTLLTGVIRKMSSVELGLTILLSAMLTLMIYSSGNRVLRVIALPGLLGLHITVSLYTYFLPKPLELNIIYPSMAVIMTWSILSLQEKITTREAFARSRGLPDSVIRLLEADMELEDRETGKLITVLEADIANYSLFSSRNPASRVRSIMIEYYETIEKIIYSHGGYVNKYIGDAVLAVFGYPLKEEGSARRAVRAAWEIQQAVSSLVQRWEAECRDSFQGIRIGLNYGYVNICYIGGAKKQLDVLGDNVDLAVRLESAAGKFDTAALLSISTYEEVQDIITGRKVPVELKNRPDVREAYTLDSIRAPGTQGT